MPPPGRTAAQRGGEYSTSTQANLSRKTRSNKTPAPKFVGANAKSRVSSIFSPPPSPSKSPSPPPTEDTAQKFVSKESRRSSLPLSAHTTPTNSPHGSRATSPTTAPKPPATNRVLIKNHVAGANNPFHLFKVIRNHKLRIPTPKNTHAYKTATTTLIFATPQDALTFTTTIPASTFGTTATYSMEPRPEKPQVPRASKPSSTPNLHVVVRGVHSEIGEDEFLSAVVPPDSCPCGKPFKRALRIRDRDGGATGLMRLFLSCEVCCDALLAHGVEVFGRRYRTEAPRHQLVRPCPRCHKFGHGASDCKVKDARCRVCGDRLAGAPCAHKGLDLTRPYCVTCREHGHYTGQRCCPQYPRDARSTPAPIRLASPTPSTSATNPWKLKPQDFPSIAPPPETTPDNDPTAESATQDGPEQQLPPPPQTYVTVDSFNLHLEKLLTSISEGFQRTFDAIISIVLASVPTPQHQPLRDQINNVTRRHFDMRTIFHPIGSSMKILHTNTKRD